MSNTQDGRFHTLKQIHKLISGKNPRVVPQRQKRRARRLGIMTLLAMLAAGFYGTYHWQYTSRFVVTNDAYVTGNLVALKAQTNGTVVDVRADNTQYVKQGDVLVRLDGLQAEVTLEKAKANLGDAVRQVEILFSNVEMLRKKLAVQEATIARYRKDLTRYRSVVAEGAVSMQQVEDTAMQITELEAGAEEINAELNAAEVLVQGVTLENNPKVLQAASAVKSAYLDKVRQKIVAPVAGFVAKRSIQPGEQIHPDMPLLAIVSLNYLWIEANFLENELTHVQPGQPVEVTTDLYGSTVIYHGEVLGLGAGTGSVFGLLPPNNATGNYIHITERVPVRISLNPKELKAHPLRPGLSVVAKIDTDQPGHSVLESLTTIPADTYQTDVYDNQLDGADKLIKKIIQQNQWPKKNAK